MDGLGYHPVEVRAVPDGQHTAQQGECGQAGLQTVASPSPSPVVADRSEENLSPRAAPRLRTTRRGSGRRVGMDRHSTRELRIAWPTAARRAVVRPASYVLWPFGRTVVPKPDAGAGSFIGNVLWFVLAGLWMAIAHIITGLALCITIIGIPLGVADVKLAAVAIAPLGKDIVRTDDPRALARAL